MCRNIKTLYNFEPPTTEDEVRAAALQFVRKVSGMNKPSRANEAAFERAIEAVAATTRELLDELVTTAPPRDREVEAERRRARAAARHRQRAGLGRQPDPPPAARLAAVLAPALAERSLELAAVLELYDDMGAADELALHEHLRDRRQAGDRRQLLPDRRIRQNVDRRHRCTGAAQRLQRAVGVPAHDERRRALHEEGD